MKNCGYKKLTSKEIAEIRKLRKAGLSLTEIHERTGRSRTTISRFSTEIYKALEAKRKIKKEKRANKEVGAAYAFDLVMRRENEIRSRRIFGDYIFEDNKKEAARLKNARFIKMPTYQEPPPASMLQYGSVHFEL